MNFNCYTCEISLEKCGHKKCYENFLDKNEITIDSIQSASEHGHLKCFIKAINNGCDLDQKICNLAAHNGQLNCVKYAH